MRKVDYEEVKIDVPGLVIDENGNIITMEEETHENFFNTIISNILGNSFNEKKLDRLLLLITEEFNYITYIGCTFGDRKFKGGTFIINSVNKLTDEQINTLINLYSTISPYYKIDIIISKDKSKCDIIVSIGEIYEELLKRNSKKIK